MAEADRLCNVQRYERGEARRDTRAGHYKRKLQETDRSILERLLFNALATRPSDPDLQWTADHRHRHWQERLSCCFLASRHHRGAFGDAQIRLAQLQPAFAGQPIEPLDRRM